MADYEFLGPYALAIFMGLGSTCIFIWGVMAGFPERPTGQPSTSITRERQARLIQTLSETHDLHEYAGGYIKAHEGVIPVWLLFVYFGLFFGLLLHRDLLLGRSRAPPTG